MDVLQIISLDRQVHLVPTGPPGPAGQPGKPGIKGKDGKSVSKDILDKMNQIIAEHNNSEKEIIIGSASYSFGFAQL